MERRFFTNDFEQSLKEHADKFQMIPSKKVWHGIYNDLHPGKRWPSVTMSLLLIFTLVVIGHLNTNNSRQLNYSTGKVAEAKKLTATVKKAGASKNNQRIVVRKTDLDKAREVFVYSAGESKNTGLEAGPTTGSHQSNSDDQNSNTHQSNNTYNSNNSNNNYESNNSQTGLLPANNLKPSGNTGTTILERNIITTAQPNTGDNTSTAENIYNKEIPLQNNVDLDGMLNNSLHGKIAANHTNSLLAEETLQEKRNTLNGEKSLADKNKDGIIPPKKIPNTENKVAKLHKKRNDKITWVYFAGPVVNSVIFDGVSLKQTPGSNLSPGLTMTTKENNVLHNSALGFEAGTQMNYALSKKLQFTTGAHFTYSGYHIISNEVHPTFATLVLREPSTGMIYARSFITHYGDGTGQSAVVLHNYSWQASIPVGLQYEFSGNNKVRFNVAGNLEPSLVLKNNAYILSSDGNNYINDPSLLRQWNLNSNFGMFVTFRSAKFKWQVGPNVRYQWMSTYKKDYTIKEHLIDYGIRLGISR